MARSRLPIAPHLTHDEIARRYRSCRGGVEKTHWQVIWLMTRPDAPPAPATVAAQIGLTPAWVRAVIKRWNAHGPDALGDRRAANRGRSKLTSAQRAELYEALRRPPPDGGLWTGPKVASFVGVRWGVVVCMQTGWEWLRNLGLTLQVPRPKNPGAATEEGQRAWKEATDRWVSELRARHPDKRVELWAEDEARLGLKPILRRVWAVKGERPTANGRARYEWAYVFGFVHPASGRNLELILPKANAEWMGLALAEFARWADPEGRKLLVVLVDNAGWHVAKGLAIPPNVVLRGLPPCTPELQPAEPLWPLLREAVANRDFANLGELEAVLVERCRWLIDHPETVRGAVGFYWAAALNG